MVNSNRPIVSVIDPCDHAFRRVKQILFSPFNFGKWFAIGFCFFLAYLGEGGGFNFNFRTGQRKYYNAENPADMLYQMKTYITDNIVEFSVIIAAGFIITFGFTILFNWLKSRGQFMSLYNIVNNKSLVKMPWTQYANEANSLMIFRILLSLLNAIIFLGLVAAGLFIVFSPEFMDQLKTTGQTFPVELVVYAIGFFSILTLCMLPFILIRTLLHDFVVPLMYINRCSCIAGWKMFGAIIRGNIGRIILFLLFRILIRAAIGTIKIVLACITCCTFACLMGIPYIGRVVILPLDMFVRCYSLYYLSQYGPQFNIFNYIETEPDTI